LSHSLLKNSLLYSPILFFSSLPPFFFSASLYL
jgi:hypothetical protein